MNGRDLHRDEKDLKEQELEYALNRFLDQLRASMILKGGEVKIEDLKKRPLGEIFKELRPNGIYLGFKVAVHSDKTYFGED